MDGDEVIGDRRTSYNNRMSQYRRERRKFSILVYTLVVIGILVTVAQWVPMILFKDIQDGIRDHYWISLVGLSVLLLTVTVFIFWQDVRFTVPFNWILAAIIVESLMVGLCRVVIQTTFETFMICFAVVSVYLILLIAIGIILPHDMTLNMVVLFFCAVIFFIGSVFFVLLHIMVGAEFSLFFYVLFVIIIVSLFSLFHAQTIHGGRYAQMRRNDHLLAALIIYHDFMILFMLSFYFLSLDNMPGPATSTTPGPRGLLLVYADNTTTTEEPTDYPTDYPSGIPIVIPTTMPTTTPTTTPTTIPTEDPTEGISTVPPDPPTDINTDEPSLVPEEPQTTIHPDFMTTAGLEEY